MCVLCLTYVNMDSIHTPEKESRALVNRMQNFSSYKGERKNHYNIRGMSLVEMRHEIQQGSIDQTCYVDILCEVLDACIAFNDSMPVCLAMIQR